MKSVDLYIETVKAKNENRAKRNDIVPPPTFPANMSFISVTLYPLNLFVKYNNGKLRKNDSIIDIIITIQISLFDGGVFNIAQ